jgi:hypothetical protein
MFFELLLPEEIGGETSSLRILSTTATGGNCRNIAINAQNPSLVPVLSMAGQAAISPCLQLSKALRIGTKAMLTTSRLNGRLSEFDHKHLLTWFTER